MKKASQSLHIDQVFSTLELLGGKACMLGNPAFKPDLLVAGGIRVGKTSIFEDMIVAAKDMTIEGNLTVLNNTVVGDFYAQNIVADSITVNTPLPAPGDSVAMYRVYNPGTIDFSTTPLLKNVTIQNSSIGELLLPTTLLTLYLFETHFNTTLVLPVLGNLAFCNFTNSTNIDCSSLVNSMVASTGLLGVALHNITSSAPFMITSFTTQTPAIPNITPFQGGLVLDAVSNVLSIANITYNTTDVADMQLFISTCASLTTIGNVTAASAVNGLTIMITNNAALTSIGMIFVVDPISSFSINFNAALTNISAIIIPMSMTGTLFSLDSNNLTAASLSNLLQAFDASGAINNSADLSSNQVDNTGLDGPGTTAYNNLLGKGWTFPGF